MNSLERSDRFRVDAAEGWLMLGNVREAKTELKGVSAAAHRHPALLRVKYEILSRDALWNEAYTVAVKLVELEPKEASHWVWRAYAVRRMKGGGLEAAFKVLIPALERFPREWIFPFNLACYACQLGRKDEAKDWYFKAVKLGGTDVRNLALEDPDLEPLRAELR